MADNYGTYARSKPRVQILKGWDPNEPRTRTRSAPVKSGVTVLSGEILALEWVSADSEWQWVLADRSNAEHRKQAPYIAQDDSVDPDVRASGQLVGLSCSGQFEVQTAYYVTPGGGDQPLPAGIALTYGDGADAGKVETTARGAGPTVPVIGVISGAHHAGPISLVGVNSEADAADLNVVQWETHYDSQNAAS